MNPRRGPHILDTNVLMYANPADNFEAKQNAPRCQAALNYLFSIMAGETTIVLDDAGDKSLILLEYQANLSYETDRLANMFLRWLLANRSNDLMCHIVPITPLDDTFEEFPTDDALRDFDPKDRKWIAAAVAYRIYFGSEAPIVQAADFKWKNFIEHFENYGVRVVFICE